MKISSIFPLIGNGMTEKINIFQVKGIFFHPPRGNSGKKFKNKEYYYVLL